MTFGGDRSGNTRGAAPSRIWLVVGAAVMLTLATVPVWREIVRAVPGKESLEAMDRQLRATFPDIASIDGAALARRLGRRDGPILLDVRSPEEFAVSRLPGAIRVDDDAIDTEVLETIGPAIKGRDIIFYCSVGVRSTRLAHRIRATLVNRGAGAIANLSGGIFGWHNAGRRLVGPDGKTTDFLHPYDEEWGLLVKRRERITYRPKNSEREAPLQ